ncbi:MAG: OBAP family protein [Acidobacteriaceae bacterium]|nr:OBAP family protein [Acidobacteriaceae bacterium]
MNRTERKLLALISLILLTACGGKNTGSYVRSPGAEESAKTRVLETGTAILQNKAPIDAINVYLDGFHFYNGNMKGQMEAHHYCSVMNEDLIQCVIFDGNSKNSKLMGVEYIISRNAYGTLPADERKLWHSHNYEVKSGELIAPGVPKPAEHSFMEKAASTYGKTWHTWNTDQGRTLPTGHPLLMMGFTADGQINKEMVADRDKRFGVSTDKEKENRADIQPPPVLPGANSWETGEVLQLSLGPLSQEAKAAMGGEHRIQSQPMPGK